MVVHSLPKPVEELGQPVDPAAEPWRGSGATSYGSTMSKQRRNQKHSAVNIEPGIYEIDSGTAEIKPDPSTSGCLAAAAQQGCNPPRSSRMNRSAWALNTCAGSPSRWLPLPTRRQPAVLTPGWCRSDLARWGADRYPHSRHTTVELDVNSPNWPVITSELRARTNYQNAGGRSGPSLGRDPSGQLGCHHPGCVYRHHPRRPHHAGHLTDWRPPKSRQRRRPMAPTS